MAIDFPSTNLIPGTVHTAAGVSWKWDGTTWQASAVGGNNNNVVTNFTDLVDTPSSQSSGKWLVSQGGSLVWTNAPAASAVGQYANTTTFPATNTNTATFAFAQDSGALYYSDGTSWTNNRIVTTNSTSHSDISSLIGLMQKTYTFDVDDYTEGNTTQNTLRKIVKLTDNLGNVQRWTLGVAGDGISISKTVNPTGDDEILLTGEVQQYTPSIVDAAPAADSILRLTGAGFDTGEQDITFKGVDGLKVERVDDSTIQFRSPTSTAYYDDDAKLAAFTALDNGTKTGITYTYDPTNKVINSTVTSSGNGNNPVVTYDLLGKNNTTNEAIIYLKPSNGVDDEVQFVGANGTTVAWDAANAKVTIDSTAPVNADWTSTTGLSKIDNKPTNASFQADWDNTDDTTLGYIKNKPTLVESLGDLDDVSSATPNTDDVLKWDPTLNSGAGGWKPAPDATGGGGSGSLSGLSDTVIDAANLSTKKRLEYDSTSGKWVNVEDTSNAVPSIDDITATSASIAANGYGTLDISNGHKAYVLYKVETDVEAWVRIYCDSTSRTNDSVRSEGNDPLPGSGVIAEVRTTASENAVLVTPGVMGFNNENPRQTNIFVAINNRSSSASTVQVKLTVLKIGD
jgi:hypothetical protein